MNPKVLIIALVLIAIGGGAAWYFVNKSKNADTASSESSGSGHVNDPSLKVDPNAPKDMKDVTELKIETLKAGNGEEAAEGKTVSVHYTGWLTNGIKFDSSIDRAMPFEFVLGAGQVIPGWDRGVKGMKVGEKRRLQIPSDQGYGPAGAGHVIPPNSTLVFDVELMAIK